jgi:hypothetical protein
MVLRARVPRLRFECVLFDYCRHKIEFLSEKIRSSSAPIFSATVLSSLCGLELLTAEFAKNGRKGRREKQDPRHYVNNLLTEVSS